MTSFLNCALMKSKQIWYIVTSVLTLPFLNEMLWLALKHQKDLFFIRESVKIYRHYVLYSLPRARSL